MHDYDILVKRSKQSIDGVVDETNDKKNHHYYTVFDVKPSIADVNQCKMKVKTCIDKMSGGIRGLIYNEKLCVTLKNRSGVIIGKKCVPLGTAFKFHGHVTIEKMIDLPCSFQNIHSVRLHFV